VAVVGLAALQIALQLFRARREEQVLGAAFPEYAAYRERVAWVGPTLHVRRGLRGVISRGV
jgi:protein-S-isoprenylcysteine O-methyltransferase Ste14